MASLCRRTNSVNNSEREIISARKKSPAFLLIRPWQRTLLVCISCCKGI
jgi:hypothetical protein